MGWLRNNWLDALIFLLFGLVVAGGVFFITGINPLTVLPKPGGSSAVASPKTAAPSPALVATPAKPVVEEPKPAEAPKADEPIIRVPTAPEEPAPVPAEAGDQTSAAKAAPAPITPSASKPSASEPKAAPGGTWRVAAGSFSDPQNALKLLQTLQAQGYPAQVEAAGSMTRVVVGPFTSEARARAVASGLSQYGARVYSGAPLGTPGSSEGSYLQAGAFKSATSAEPLIAKLKAAGFPVVLVHEGGLIKVRVGPVPDKAETKAALGKMGIQAVEVR